MDVPFPGQSTIQFTPPSTATLLVTHHRGEKSLARAGACTPRDCGYASWASNGSFALFESSFVFDADIASEAWRSVAHLRFRWARKLHFEAFGHASKQYEGSMKLEIGQLVGWRPSLLGWSR